MKQTSVGSFIRERRQQKGMTQKTLAEQLHVTDKAVSKWERDLSYPDIELLPKLAEVLGVTVGDIIREAGDEDRSDELLHQYELSSDVSAPLNIILGCTDLIEMYREDKGKCEHYLDTIRVSAEYLLSVLGEKSSRRVSDTEYNQMIHHRLEGVLEERSHKCESPTEQDDNAADYDFSGKRILVAEDSETDREIIRDMLRETETDMEFASDGLTCVRMVEKSPPGYYDLILMDIMMPNMNGLEAARQIRTMISDSKAQLPIIAITANTEKIDRSVAFAAGMSAFTEKPIIIKELLGTIEEYLFP